LGNYTLKLSGSSLRTDFWGVSRGNSRCAGGAKRAAGIQLQVEGVPIVGRRARALGNPHKRKCPAAAGGGLPLGVLADPSLASTLDAMERGHTRLWLPYSQEMGITPQNRNSDPAGVVTLAHLLSGAVDGSGPADALFGALYRELHRLARRELHRGGAPTLGATTLLHETYLDLRDRGLDFPDRARFLAYAARAMRGLIVDHARRARAVKRGGAFHITSFDATGAADVAASEELEPLSNALDALVQADPGLAELVELKYFCGFTLAEIATMRRDRAHHAAPLGKGTGVPHARAQPACTMTAISPARWAELSPHLDALLELPAPDRTARLHAMRAQDTLAWPTNCSTCSNAPQPPMRWPSSMPRSARATPVGRGWRAALGRSSGCSAAAAWAASGSRTAAMDATTTRPR